MDEGILSFDMHAANVSGKPLSRSAVVDRDSVKDVISIFYAPIHRTGLLLVAMVLIVLIALIDWRIEPYISLGFLYLFPVIILSGFLSRPQIVAVGLACAVLDFTNLPKPVGFVHLLFSSAGFVGTGLFVSEFVRNRRMMTHKHMGELQELRRESQEQLQTLVESSPAAIITIDAQGHILLANEAAQQLLAPESSALQGQDIGGYLPALCTVLQAQASRTFRTAMQCRAQRSNGQSFLAGIWFSTYLALSGPRLSAIIVDLSEDLRNREDLSLDHLLKNSRILMAAVAHEVRNLSSAMQVVHKNLAAIDQLRSNEDFYALSTLIESLEKITALELRTDQYAAPVDLNSVLDEARVLIDSAYRESGMEVQWCLPSQLPLIWADRYSLIQVFLNLARNSQRAMQSHPTKKLRIGAAIQEQNVYIRFEDSGPGVPQNSTLFRPFQSGAEATGLGLYMSRAMLRSFGADLVHEPTPTGCCFRIVLHSYSPVEEQMHA